MSNEKRFKKGDIIFKEGDTLQSLFVLQSGKVSLFIERGGQKTEIDQPIIGHVLGEQSVFGYAKQSYNAEAHSEVRVIEVPLEPIKTVYEKSPGPYKIFVKALGEDLRRLRNLMKSVKQESESSACPQRFIPRLAAILTLVAKHVGKPPEDDPKIPAYKREEEKAKNPHFKDDDLIVSFSILKIYTARMFMESHQRMQSFCELLSKLGFLTLRYEKNEDTELMELQEIRVHDLQTIELFGEFYQHNFFKAGKSEVIDVDKTAVRVAAGFVDLTKDLELDRYGVVRIEYQKLIEGMKEKFFFDLKEVHVGLLEKKGLYMKRQNIDGTLWVQLDKFEWASTHRYWQIIQEIDRWNEKGVVNVSENLNEYKPSGPEKCPGCEVVITAASKFCSECGYKLGAAKAA